MANFRVSLFIEWGKQGWTENFYLDASDRVKAEQVAGALVQARRPLLSKTANVAYARVVVPGPPRDASFFSYGAFLGSGGWPVNAETTAAGDEISQAAVNCRVFAGPNVWRSWLVRGLPQEAIDHSSPVAFVTPIYRAALVTFFQFLFANGFQIRSQNLGANAIVDAVTFIANKLSTLTFVGAIPAGVVPGSVIQLAYGVGVSNFNGTWRVLATASPALRVYSKIKQQLGTYIAQSAVGRLVTYTYGAMTALSVVGPTSRRTGRPSYQPRGKRSVQRA